MTADAVGLDHPGLSERIREILMVLNGIRQANPTTPEELARARGAAARNATHRLGHKSPRTVPDKYVRYLGLRRTDEFDQLVLAWLTQGSPELQKLLDAHVGTGTGTADLRAIRGFFGDAPAAPAAPTTQHAAATPALLDGPAGTPSPEPAAAALPPPATSYADLLHSLAASGLHFPEETIANYLLALQTNRLVILTGVSGTGKTRLALRVAERLSPTLAAATPAATPACVVAVRPDWTDNRGLLGYYNPLAERYVVTPLLQSLLRAQEETERAKRTQRPPSPFFVILDEMNLARVEHYFSDFLSCLESGEPLHLHDDEELEAGKRDHAAPVPRRLQIAENVFITGTVNIDETTYMFSPKVLDRAFTLELNQVDLAGYGIGPPPGPDQPASPLALTAWPGSLQLLPKPCLDDWQAFRPLLDGGLHALLLSLHQLLSREQRPFGYRVANEIARFVTLARDQAGDAAATLEAALDLAILQKVLPKLHGTQQELERPLAALFAFAVTGGADSPEDWCSWQLTLGGLQPGSAGADAPRPPTLPRTATKLWRMLQRLHQQGFTSFME